MSTETDAALEGAYTDQLEHPFRRDDFGFFFADGGHAVVYTIARQGLFVDQ